MWYLYKTVACFAFLLCTGTYGCLRRSPTSSSLDKQRHTTIQHNPMSCSDILIKLKLYVLSYEWTQLSAPTMHSHIQCTAVGKSAILTRFSENAFLNNYSSTIGIDFNSRMIRVDHAICKLEIWDTAGE